MAVVVVVVVAAVVEAAVDSVELWRERLTVTSVELQRSSLQLQREVTVS